MPLIDTNTNLIAKNVADSVFAYWEYSLGSKTSTDSLL